MSISDHLKISKEIDKIDLNNTEKITKTTNKTSNKTTNKTSNKTTNKTLPPKISIPKIIHDLEDETVLQAMRLRLRNALRKVINPLIHNKDSIENRIYYAKILRKYLSNIQSCVQSSIDDPNKIVLFEKNKEGKIKEKIIFDKRIGSDSVYGTAYLNVGKGFGRLLKFSIKIMSSKFKLEVQILRKMTALVEKNISPNMPITFTSMLCDKSNDINLDVNTSAIDLMKKGDYYVIINELADGDMHDFFKKRHHINVYESVISQMIFAIQSFHSNLNYIHKDTHLGNFLYHKVKPGGFWKYKYEDTTIYIPNLGYLIVLWDPGLAQKPSMKTLAPDKNKDFFRTLKLINAIKNLPTYIKMQLKPIRPEDFQVFKDILISVNTHPNYEYENYIMDMYVSMLETNRFQNIYYEENDISTLPSNRTIINETPYIL